jgi:hypothetical protein
MDGFHTRSKESPSRDGLRDTACESAVAESLTPSDVAAQEANSVNSNAASRLLI